MMDPEIWKVFDEIKEEVKEEKSCNHQDTFIDCGCSVCLDCGQIVSSNISLFFLLQSSLQTPRHVPTQTVQSLSWICSFLHCAPSICDPSVSSFQHISSPSSNSLRRKHKTSSPLCRNLPAGRQV